MILNCTMGMFTAGYCTSPRSHHFSQLDPASRQPILDHHREAWQLPVEEHPPGSSKSEVGVTRTHVGGFQEWGIPKIDPVRREYSH